MNMYYDDKNTFAFVKLYKTIEHLGQILILSILKFVLIYFRVFFMMLWWDKMYFDEKII